MKNNRQIGLDGRSFLTACLKRSPKSVIALILFGVVSAAGDIFKLTGASGAEMGSFTTTLLIYDFLAALMMIIVTFYCYFLECGLNIPTLREKPVVLFGCVRLCYYVLLDYYLFYRALYCIANHDSVPVFVTVFYSAIFLSTFMAILANSFYLNILSRNMIRRSYEKSVRTLAVFGTVFQLAVPIAFVVCRFTMGDYADEYLTASLTDTLRLFVAPALYLSLWVVFHNAIPQVKEVYDEVDDALRNRRYQITYNAEGKKKKKLPQPKKKKPAGKLTAARKKEIERMAALAMAQEKKELAEAAALKAAEASKEEKPAEQEAAQAEKPVMPEQPAVSEQTAPTEDKKEEAKAEAPAAQPVSNFTANQLEQIAQEAVKKASAPQPPAPKPIKYAAPGQVEDFDPNAALRPAAKPQHTVHNQNKPQAAKRPSASRPSGHKKSGSSKRKYYPPKNNGQN